MVHHIENRITYILNFRTTNAKYLTAVYRFQFKTSPVQNQKKKKNDE